jgi:hypothetical protein
MGRVSVCLAALLMLGGCGLQPQRPSSEMPEVADRPAAAPVDVGVNWGWRVVGDAAVRPVQVFSMNGQTYLQMRDRRPVVLLAGGEIVPFMTSWPYLVIQGEPDHVDIVADGYRAIATRVSSSDRMGMPADIAITNASRKEPPAVAESRRVERVKLQ